jgi:bacteriorhodopsin
VVFAIGMRLAEAASEHLWLVVAVMVAIVLIVLWPRIAQRVDDWARRR